MFRAILAIVSILFLIFSFSSLTGLITFYSTSIKYYNCTNNYYYNQYDCFDVQIVNCIINDNECFEIICDYYKNNEKYVFNYQCYDSVSINCNQNYINGGNATIYLSNDKHFLVTNVITALSIIFTIVSSIAMSVLLSKFFNSYYENNNINLHNIDLYNQI